MFIKDRQRRDTFVNQAMERTLGPPARRPAAAGRGEGPPAAGPHLQEGPGRAGSRGLAGFIQKPYRYEVLATALRIALESGGEQSELSG